MVCGDKFAWCIFATNVFTMALLMLASGRSPMLGLSHLSTQHRQLATVAGFAGRRFLFTEWFKNHSASSRNVVATWFSAHCFASFTPLASTISFALHRLSPLVRYPGAFRSTGQIFSLA